MTPTQRAVYSHFVEGADVTNMTAWTAVEFALLGTAPDRVIAQALNRTVGAVARARVARGIPAFVAPPNDVQTQHQIL